MCKDVYNTAIWTLLVVSALVSAYQIYNLATMQQAAAQQFLLILGYVAYAMPVLALVFYAIKPIRWLAVIAAGIAVALSNSVAMAAFLLIYVYGAISGKE